MASVSHIYTTPTACPVLSGCRGYVYTAHRVLGTPPCRCHTLLSMPRPAAFVCVTPSGASQCPPPSPPPQWPVTVWHCHTPVVATRHSSPGQRPHRLCAHDRTSATHTLQAHVHQIHSSCSTLTPDIVVGTQSGCRAAGAPCGRMRPVRHTRLTLEPPAATPHRRCCDRNSMTGTPSYGGHCNRGSRYRLPAHVSGHISILERLPSPAPGRLARSQTSPRCSCWHRHGTTMHAVWLGILWVRMLWVGPPRRGWSS